MRRLWPIAFCALAVGSGLAWGSPVDPAIDEGPGPFSYFSRPSTVLGVADGQEGTQVTPEGWLYTGSAQLVLFAGADLAPLRQRIRTLRDNHLPIVSYSLERDGVEYSVTMFGATLDSRPESDLVNFIRVTMTPSGEAGATATLAVGFRAEGPRCCERMKRPADLLGAEYSLGEFYAARGDSAIYLFPTDPEPCCLVLPDVEGRGPISGLKAPVVAAAPVCLVRYDLALAPGRSRSLDFKMPCAPVPLADSEALEALRRADFDEHLARTEGWWRDYLAEGLQLDLPEPKVVDTFRTCIVYDSIARDRVGEDYICKVNEFQYDGFWVRDGAYICAAFDFAGRHRWAEQCLEYFLKQQRDDDIIYQPPQLDGWGQALWAFGQHWRVTGDDDWARRMYPYLARSVRGIFVKTHEDPLGLVPAAPPYDNEAINGHYTGHSLWLMTGLRDIIAMADALGQADDARQFRAWYDEYRDSFLRAIGPITQKTGGYLPPGLDAENGCDWGNLLLLYPRGGVPACGNFDLDDPRVTATVDTVRERKYAEGIMTYGRGLTPALLHHYLTMKVTENLVTQNRQRDALADFYSLLVHTSATHAGFEFSIRPWGNRDPGGNLPPHGWFAAKYMALLRNMLVREWDGELHLFSVLSPEWVKPGDVIAFRRAPTDFGEVSARARVADDGLSLQLSSRWRSAPSGIVLHVPWFVEASAATADGRACAITRPPIGDGQQVLLPPDAGAVRLIWRRLSDPALSYTRAVEGFKGEYRRRFDEFVAGGGKPEPLWLEASLPMTEEARREQWALMQARYGIAVGCATTASKSDAGHPPAAAVDGNADRTVHWAATPYPQWWQVDLGEPRAIEGVRVVTYWDTGDDARHYQYRVLTSPDGDDWTTVADLSENKTPGTPSGMLHRLKPVPARYVRVEMLHNSANVGVHLAEVMVLPGVDAPVAEAPAASRAAWTAEDQTGARPADFPSWGFVGAERIVLQAEHIRAAGDRVRLEFRGGEKGSIVISDVSIAATDPKDPRDLLPGTRVPLSFDGSGRVELPAGKPVWTDWVRFPLQTGPDCTVTFAVEQTGATTLWSDEKTTRYETADGGAARVGKWSELAPSETYNVYFFSRLEVPAEQ